MRNRHSALLASLLILLAACGSDPTTGEDAIVVRDSAGVAIVDNDLLRLGATCSLGATPTISIGEEDGGEEYEFQGVSGARRLSDGRIVVLDQRARKLRWYGADGRYIRSSGREGNGPGEFANPYGLFALPGDTVHVADAEIFQFVIFRPDGEYARMVRPEPAVQPGTFGLLGDGRIMLAMDVQGFAEQTSGSFLQQTRRMELHSADGTILDTLETVPNGRMGKVIPTSFVSTMPLFESYSHAAALDSIIVLGHGAERELRVWSGRPEMKLVRLVRWTGGSREVTKADVDAEKAREKRVLDAAQPSMRQFMEQAYETHVHPDRPTADVMPAMNAIRLGTDGRIWIREYQPPVDTTPRRWVAFTRDGRFDCRLSTPPYRSFTEFGDDYLLVSEADSLGVQRVRQYPLSKP